jgi:hypothetical protein
VSDADKRDPERGLAFVEKLLVEDEAERIEKLSGDELRAELRAAGVDPARVPDGKELQRRLLARRKREGDGAGAQGGEPAPTPRRANPVVPIRRWPRVAWLLAAALAVAILLALSGPAVVARFHDEQGNTGEEAPRPTRHEAAENLRDEAMDRCAQAAWSTCRDKLDEAARLDPAGESEPRVKKARADLESASHPGPKLPNNPGP